MDLGGAEQAREAAVLGIPVLLAALGDHGAAGVGGDDLLRLVGRGAEHAHGVIVRQHHVLDGLVGDLGDPLDDLPGHGRRRLRVDDDDAVVADDHAAVGVALGGEGVEVAADLGEGDLLLGSCRRWRRRSCSCAFSLASDWSCRHRGGRPWRRRRWRRRRPPPGRDAGNVRIGRAPGARSARWRGPRCGRAAPAYRTRRLQPLDQQHGRVHACNQSLDGPVRGTRAPARCRPSRGTHHRRGRGIWPAGT